MALNERLVSLNTSEEFLRDDVDMALDDDDVLVKALEELAAKALLVDEGPMLRCRANDFLFSSSFSFDGRLLALEASLLANERLVAFL